MPDRPWLATYPDGVPAEIDPEAYPSLIELLEERFERYGDAPAFVNRGTELSFREVEQTSRAFAAYLQSLGGVERGDRVAVMLPNLLHSPVVIFGVLRAGLVVVNVNPLCTARELERVLADSGARVLVVLENFAATVERARRGVVLEHVLVARLGDHFPWAKRTVANLVVKHVARAVPAHRLERAVDYRAALAEGMKLVYERPALSQAELAFLQYTGGTTGVPKGAMLSHRNVVSNVLQATAWVAPQFDLTGRDAVTALPLYHIFALTVNLLALTVLGARNVLITDPRDLDGFVAELGRARMAVLTGVNTLFRALLRHEGFRALDFAPLGLVLSGGMAVQREVAVEWQAVTGTVIAQGYGLTEASPIVTASPVAAAEFSASVGLPLPSTDVKVVANDGRDLGIEASGEICVKGPQVMLGYWRNEAETRDAFLPDGWLKTGDLGRLDARGHLFIEDRKKDMIKVSGFNVYPSEIEDLVSKLAGVLESAAIGVPDEDTGEAVELFVVKGDPALTEREVVEHCREGLTRYKVPQSIRFVDELPKSGVGKVLKRALRGIEDTKLGSNSSDPREL